MLSAKNFEDRFCVFKSCYTNSEELNIDLVLLLLVFDVEAVDKMHLLMFCVTELGILAQHPSSCICIYVYIPVNIYGSEIVANVRHNMYDKYYW